MCKNITIASVHTWAHGHVCGQAPAVVLLEDAQRKLLERGRLVRHDAAVLADLVVELARLRAHGAVWVPGCDTGTPGQISGLPAGA